VEEPVTLENISPRSKAALFPSLVEKAAFLVRQSRSRSGSGSRLFPKGLAILTGDRELELSEDPIPRSGTTCSKGPPVWTLYGENIAGGPSSLLQKPKTFHDPLSSLGKVRPTTAAYSEATERSRTLCRPRWGLVGGRKSAHNPARCGASDLHAGLNKHALRLPLAHFPEPHP
jgi:hypothetical protein